MSVQAAGIENCFENQCLISAWFARSLTSLTKAACAPTVELTLKLKEVDYLLNFAREMLQAGDIGTARVSRRRFAWDGRNLCSRHACINLWIIKYVAPLRRAANATWPESDDSVATRKANSKHKPTKGASHVAR